MARGWGICPAPASDEAIRNDVERSWEVSGGLLVPTFDLLCPVCGSGRVQVRQWAFHLQSESPRPWRCDVMMRCRDCEAVWTHGVPVSEALYDERYWDEQGDMGYRYSEVYRRMQETGSPVPPRRAGAPPSLEAPASGTMGARDRIDAIKEVR